MQFRVSSAYGFENDYLELVGIAQLGPRGTERPMGLAVCIRATVWPDFIVIASPSGPEDDGRGTIAPYKAFPRTDLR